MKKVIFRIDVNDFGKFQAGKEVPIYCGHFSPEATLQIVAEVNRIQIIKPARDKGKGVFLVSQMT